MCIILPVNNYLSCEVKFPFDNVCFNNQTCIVVDQLLYYQDSKTTICQLTYELERNPTSYDTSFTDQITFNNSSVNCNVLRFAPIKCWAYYIVDKPSLQRGVGPTRCLNRKKTKPEVCTEEYNFLIASTIIGSISLSLFAICAYLQCKSMYRSIMLVWY
jgi:hypothetical protein